MNGTASGQMVIQQRTFVAAQAGRAVSIFIGGFGNNITKPAETTATEFRCH